MENWVERKTPQGRPYFCNLVTQETTWDYDEIDSETGRLVIFYKVQTSKIVYLHFRFFSHP